MTQLTWPAVGLLAVLAAVVVALAILTTMQPEAIIAIVTLLATIGGGAAVAGGVGGRVDQVHAETTAQTAQLTTIEKNTNGCPSRNARTSPSGPRPRCCASKAGSDGRPDARPAQPRTAARHRVPEPQAARRLDRRRRPPQAHVGHNPDDTAGSRPAWDGDPDTLAEVRALDVAVDLGDGVTGQDLVNHLIRLPKLATVIRYLIHRGRIYHERHGFEPQAFDGDPHTDHVHAEGAWTQAGDNNVSFDCQREGIPVALNADDLVRIQKMIPTKEDIAKEVLRTFRINKAQPVRHRGQPDRGRHHPVDPGRQEADRTVPGERGQKGLTCSRRTRIG